jgi:CHASE2 domain-containing sensor protein
MGVVYQAFHQGIKRDCAVKVLRGLEPDETARRRFRAEAEALGALRHPHIVDVTDFGVDARADGIPYLVMELLHGRALDAAIEEWARQPPEQALELLAQIASAVDHAHAHGILHRDLKPANIFLLGGRSPQAKVVDFGIARLGRPGELAPRPATSPKAGIPVHLLDLATLDATTSQSPGDGRITSGGGEPGTPAYMAPEVLRLQPASRASDVYAFALVAHELLVGRRPFEGSVAEIVQAHIDRAPAPPSSLRPALPMVLDGPLLRGLAKDPAARPASAGALVDELRSALAGHDARRIRARDVPRRLGMGLALGVSVAVLAISPAARLLDGLERRSLDLRYRWSAVRPPDPRLALVTIGDEPLQDEAPLASRGEEFGRLLARALDAGAAAVALDVAAKAWATSPAFTELLVRHAPRLTLFLKADAEGHLVGEDVVGPMARAGLGGPAAREMLGVANEVEDPDGVVRRWRLSFPTRDGASLPSFAARAASTLTGAPVRVPADPFWLDHRIDASYPAVSWAEFPRRLETDPGWVKGRLLIVGVAYSGSGDEWHRVPGGALTGHTLQARAVDTLLRGAVLRSAPTSAVAAALGGLASLVASATLVLGWRATRPILGLALLGWPAAALHLFSIDRVWPVAGPVCALALCALAAAVLEWRLGPLPVIPRPGGTR